MNLRNTSRAGASPFSRLLAITSLCLALFAAPALTAGEHGAFNYIYETGDWKYEQDIGWLFAFDAGGGSEYLYSFDIGWIWHQPDYGGWVFSWGFVQPQWTLKPTIVRAVRNQAIAHPMDDRPASDPVNILDWEVDDGTLHATVEYPGSGPFSTFFLYVQDSLGAGDSAEAEAWIVRNSRGDTGTTPIRQDLTFDLGPMDDDWGRAPDQLFALHVNPDLVLSAIETRSTHDTADLTWSTSGPASVTVEYGPSENDLSLSADSLDAGGTFHSIGIYDLDVDSTYYYRVAATPEGGDPVTSEVRTFSTNPVHEPFRARPFPVMKDLVVDRTPFETIQQAGGFVTVNTGQALDGNTVPIPKTVADKAMDAAACIGCGACVAACKNGSAMLFTAAKASQLNILPQGKPEKDRRVLNMVRTMDEAGFGNCTNFGECEAVCPKGISLDFIAKMNRDYATASLKQLLGTPV